MFKRYFQEELSNLKDLGEAFSKAHPAVAPMLSGHTADPDVERLLEGVAFLTAMLRGKLDDEFPEIVHEMVRLIWPHYLRPIPATAIVAFKPKASLKQSLTIPSGVHIASVPVDGTSCKFKTCFDVTVHPLTLMDADHITASGRPSAIKLTFELKGLPLAEWQPDKLRFHLGGEFSKAADLYFLLRNQLSKIILRSPDSPQVFELPPDALKPAGFADDEGILPFPSQSFPGFRILQEFFVQPEKFLFFDLEGWDRWRHRGDGNRFEVIFEFREIPFGSLRVKTSDFILFATPVVNVFPYEADPIRLDHKKTEYRIRPSGNNDAHYQVYSVEKVVGYVQGTAREHVYSPFDLFSAGAHRQPVYHIHSRKSQIRPGIDVSLSIAHPSGYHSAAMETLSLKLQCTNGFLPENLQPGDICQPTSTSPELVEFRNISVPNAAILPPLGSNLLWKLVSHLSLNYLTLEKAENLRSLLQLYVFEEGRDKPAILANLKRIDGIGHVNARPSDRIVRGVMMRGREIELGIRQDHFASMGDLYLFCSVLEYFLGIYGSINTFTRLTLREILTGADYHWPARTGEHYLV